MPKLYTKVQDRTIKWTNSGGKWNTGLRINLAQLRQKVVTKHFKGTLNRWDLELDRQGQSQLSDSDTDTEKANNVI